VIERWDLVRVRLFLTGVVESREALAWPEFAARIGRIGMWEFDDRRPRRPAGSAGDEAKPGTGASVAPVAGPAAAR
jgi:hypothetical protein